MESIQILLLLLTSSVLCCDATSALYPAPPEGGRWKEQLLGQLLEGYDTDVEPPLTSGQLNTTVNVSLSIYCATTMGPYVSIEGAIVMLWKDARLSWDPSSYGEPGETLRISPSRIWKPDLRLFTGGDARVTEVLALVFSDGTVFWFPPVDLYIGCQDSLNDTTNCNFRFGSWTYAGDIIDVRLTSPNMLSAVNLENYSEACPLIVQSHEAKRNVKYYEYIEEPYIDIAINLQLAWRPSR